MASHDAKPQKDNLLDDVQSESDSLCDVNNQFTGRILNDLPVNTPLKLNNKEEFDVMQINFDTVDDTTTQYIVTPTKPKKVKAAATSAMSFGGPENKENLFEDEKKPLWTLYQASTSTVAPKMETDHCITLLSSDEDDSVVILSPSPSSNKSTSILASVQQIDQEIQDSKTDLKLKNEMIDLLSDKTTTKVKGEETLISTKIEAPDVQDTKVKLELKTSTPKIKTEPKRKTRKTPNKSNWNDHQDVLMSDGEQQENKQNLIFDDDEKKPLWTISRTSCITLSSDEDDSVVVIPLSPPAKTSTSLLEMFNSTEIESDVPDTRVKLMPKRKKAETTIDNRTSNASVVPKIDTDLCITVFSDEDDPVPSSSKPYVVIPPPPTLSVRIPPPLPRSVAISPSPSTTISTSLLEMLNSTNMIEPNIPNTKVKHVSKRKTKKIEQDEVVRSPRKGRVIPKVNNKRKINAITKTSDTEDNDSMRATTGMADFEGAMITRKKLRDSFQISKQSFEAEQGERLRAIRLIKKEEILREEISVKLPDFEQRIILDIDRDNKEILAEVDRRFVAILKKHQVDGVRFMFDCTIESIRRFEDEEKEKCEIENGGSFGGILAHCMGLGKTLQVIVFINTILTNPVTSKRINKVLIIVPLNVIKNWESEFDCWFHRCKLRRSFGLFELYTIKGGKRRAEMLLKWRQKGGVMLITAGLFVELLMGDKPYGDTFEKCLLNPGPDMVIIDEGHMLKNDETCLNSVASRIATLRRIILTGTPLQNNLIEYFCMISFVKPNLLGSKSEFSNRFANPITNGQYSDSTELDVHIMKKTFFVLHKMLDSCIHRRDYNVLVPYLKPKCEYVLDIALSEAQKKLYQAYLDKFVFGQELGQNSARGKLFLHFILLGLIWNHPALLIDYLNKCQRRMDEHKQRWGSDEEDDDEYEDSRKARKKTREPILQSVQKIIGDWPYEFVPRDDDSQLYSPELGTKFKFMFAILEQCAQLKDKLLIFSQSLDVLSLIEKMLKGKTKKKTGNNTFDDCWVKNRDYFRIDGSVSPDERQNIIEQINDEANEEARLLLLSTKAGGIGINLVGANRAIIFDTCWNPAHDVQAVYRIFRYGQKKHVFVYRFAAAGTMESKIYKRQITKQSNALRVLDECQIERYYTKTDIRELYDLVDESKVNDVLPVPGKDRMLSRLLHTHRQLITSYHEHDSLLENRPEEDLSNEDREKAWEEFLRQQKEEGWKFHDGPTSVNASGTAATSGSMKALKTIRNRMEKQQQTTPKKNYKNNLKVASVKNETVVKETDEEAALSGDSETDKPQVLSSSKCHSRVMDSDGRMLNVVKLEDQMPKVEPLALVRFVPEMICLDSDEEEKDEMKDATTETINLDSDSEVKTPVAIRSSTIARPPKLAVTFVNGQPAQGGSDQFMAILDEVLSKLHSSKTSSASEQSK